MSFCLIACIFVQPGVVIQRRVAATPPRPGRPRGPQQPGGPTAALQPLKLTHWPFRSQNPRPRSDLLLLRRFLPCSARPCLWGQLPAGRETNCQPQIIFYTRTCGVPVPVPIHSVFLVQWKFCFIFPYPTDTGTVPTEWYTFVHKILLVYSIICSGISWRNFLTGWLVTASQEPNPEPSLRVGSGSRGHK